MQTEPTWPVNSWNRALERTAKSLTPAAETSTISPTVAKVLLTDDRAGAGQLFDGRQDNVGGVDARLVEERLVPRDERRRLPALIVVEGQHGEPLRQERDPFPLAPAPLPLRQSQRERQLDRHVLILVDVAGKADLERRGVVRTEEERQRDPGRRLARPAFAHQANLLDLQGWAVQIDRVAGRKAEDLERFGVQSELIAGDRIMRMCVEDEIGCRPRVVVGPGDPLTDDDAVFGHLEAHAQIVVGQPRRYVREGQGRPE